MFFVVTVPVIIGMIIRKIFNNFIERNMKIWDLAAIEPIISNSGGIISTWDGKKIGSNDTVCASGDKRLHNLMVNSLQNYI